MEQEDLETFENNSSHRLHIKNYRDAMRRLTIKNSEDERETRKQVLQEVAEQTKNTEDYQEFVDNYMTQEEGAVQ